MSSDKHLLTAYDLSSLRTFQNVATTAAIPVNNIHSNNNSRSNNNSNSNTTNMVLSTIPLDGHALVIQQPHLVSTTVGQQRSSATAMMSNGFSNHSSSNNLQSRTTTTSINNLITVASTQPTTKATIINNNTMSGNSNNNSISNNNSLHSIPTSSKYVFLQQNGNGQYTTYEGTASTTANNVGNIVLVATEPMELAGGVESHIITGENDEELRPLSWLNDKNLIKGIVTSGGGVAGAVGAGGKSQLSNNICIVNANDGTHEFIEELPPHVACEEHVTSIATSNVGCSSTAATTTTMSLHDMPETQITTLSVSDFQQQFISSNNIGGNKRSNSVNSSNGQQHQQLASLATFALAQETVKDQQQQQQQHIFNNIATLGATTTVHVGPSGTTTVVEYKSNANFMPTQRQLINGMNSSSNNHNNNNNNVATVSTNNNISPTTTATNNNHSINNYVPSSVSNAPSANSATTLHASPAAQGSPLKQTLTLPNNVNTVVVGANFASGNSSSSSYIQQQKQSNCNSSSSTSHHPHKKYLREKMNGLDQGGGGSGGGGVGAHNTSGSNSTATSVVSSPASSSSSNSTLSSSLSTGAVNGANSPVSKSNCSTYYTLIGSAGTSGVSAGGVGGGGSNNNSCSSGGGHYSGSFPATNTNTAIPSNTNYTIVNQNQQQQQIITSPESNSKDYYSTQQQKHQIVLKSPKSYSSYENDSLKDFEISTTNSGRLTTSTPQQQQRQNHHHHHNQQLQNQSPSPTHHHQKQSAMSPASSTSSSTTAAATPQKQKHPNNVPYDPLVHTHNKPPYSFSSLIFMAIEGSVEKALPVKEIYAWIVQHFPYFKTAPTGWKNSVRHNLSLNKSFVKVEKAPNMGKGSLWRVEQQQRQNLIQALTRSPFFPNSAVDKINLKSATASAYDAVDGSSPTMSHTNGGGSSAGGGGNNKSSCIDARFDARLFPKLSKVFKDMEEHNALSENGNFGPAVEMANDDVPSDYSTTKRSKYYYNNNNNGSNGNTNTNNGLQPQLNGGGVGVAASSACNCYDNMERLARDCGADSIDDVNAATAMLALKHGPKVFTETFQNGAPVITSSPSEDHTYSAGVGGGGVVSGAGSGNLSNGSAVVISNGGSTSSNAESQQHGQHGRCGDNQSNGASSDAAYESSEENHKITPEELADQQRHRDGVDALLSLSLSSFMDSSSPIKRPPSNTVEEEHISSCLENVTPSSGVRKMALMNANVESATTNQSGSGFQLLHHPRHPHHYQHQHHSIFDEGYNTQSYYGSSSNNNSNSSHYMASPSTPKKPKPLRNLRAKIKRKTTWIR